KKKWNDGNKYFDKLDWDKLTAEQQAEYHFKRGYCLFVTGKKEEAKLAFYKLKDEKNKFSPAALYYYSHIHYEEENYQTALNGFLQITDDKYFGPVVPYYIVQIYFMQKKYDEIIEFVPTIIDNVTDKRLAEVSRVAAEAFYHEERYDESLPYFRKYIENAPKVSKQDKYQMAYAYYKSDSLNKASEMFEAISTSDEKIGQNASYYLADCYLKQGDKANARKAFASASRKDFDPVIKKDALFNYALLCYEQPNDPFNEAIHAFEEYLRLYPEANNVDEASRFLVQAYLSTKNYTKALESIDRLKIESDELKRAYLRIAFNRGIELFNNLEFNPALKLFQKAEKYGKYDKVLYAKTLYWSAEAKYRLKNYKGAITSYKAFKNSSVAYLTENFELADYNMAYCYFQLKDYTNAAIWFKKFIGKSDDDFEAQTADAFNRLGDSYYMSSSYTLAITYYDKAIQSKISSGDYAYLHKAICLGLIGRHNEKITTIDAMLKEYPNSSYCDDAWKEKAQAYINLQNIEAATQSLHSLITHYPSSEIRGVAMVQLGLLYYNVDNTKKAINVLQAAVKEYPNTQISRDAMSGLKNVYVDINKVEDYTDFIHSLGDEGPKVSVSEQDSLLYVSAENIYMSGDCDKSSESFKKYIERFPNGAFILNAHFYKADCDYQKMRDEEALKSFDYVISQPHNRFTTQALLGAGRVSVQAKQHDNTIHYYQKLLETNTSEGNVKEAKIAILRSLYITEKYRKAVDAAKEVMVIPKLKPEVKREAGFILAKSYEEIGRDALALEEYRKLAKEVVSKEGAESKFKVAELLYNKGDLEESEKVILNFSEQSSPHDYWIARSFILWADIFLKRDDTFQAVETLQSIIDFYE
ncbi:MAG: tetratricopeptide repeat protein, partial [Bacteroidales bacterium]|nr:tetratricopeptide repeat protein [Bacteroidales bacterium]